jgi:hypothetical protein
LLKNGKRPFHRLKFQLLAEFKRKHSRLRGQVRLTRFRSSATGVPAHGLGRS